MQSVLESTYAGASNSESNFKIHLLGANLVRFEMLRLRAARYTGERVGHALRRVRKYVDFGAKCVHKVETKWPENRVMNDLD